MPFNPSNASKKSSENSIGFCRLLQIFLKLFNKVSIETNSVDPDQTAPIGEVLSGSTLIVGKAS